MLDTPAIPPSTPCLSTWTLDRAQLAVSSAIGRLLDHIEAENCVLNQVEYVVLDEADRMLDIGFLPDLQRILSYLPKTRQTLLFSATFSPEIKRLAITANTPFSQWGEVFVEPAMTLAAVDRLVHHSTILEMNVESYRRRAAQQGLAPAARKTR